MFGQLSDDALDRVADSVIERSYKKGHLLFSQGDRGDSLFVLAEGLVKVFVLSPKGDETVLTLLRSPATFGDLALVDGGPRSASVEVLEPSKLLQLDRIVFLALIERYASVREGLLASLGKIIRRLTEQTSDHVFLDLHGRVAKLLVYFAERQGEHAEPTTELRPPITQADIAHMVGGSRQSVNQILQSMQERGHIELRGRRILIRRLDLLRERAGL